MIPTVSVTSSHIDVGNQWTASINECLDRLPIGKRIDFATAAEALQSVVDPFHDHLVPLFLKESIEQIQQQLAHPERYVACSSDFGKFKQTILQQVIVKIQELRHLLYASEDLRAQYISQKLEAQREQALFLEARELPPLFPDPPLPDHQESSPSLSPLRIRHLGSFSMSDEEIDELTGEGASLALDVQEEEVLHRADLETRHQQSPESIFFDTI